MELKGLNCLRGSRSSYLAGDEVAVLKDLLSWH